MQMGAWGPIIKDLKIKLFIKEEGRIFSYELSWLTMQCIQRLILKDSPPIGAPKQQATPTAQAAANISLFLDSLAYVP